MKRAIVLAATLLLPLAVGAQTLTASLDGGAGVGVATLVITGDTIDYVIVTSDLDSPTSAVITDGSATVADLGATFTFGTAIGSTTSTMASTFAATPASYFVEVGNGTGTISGPLSSADVGDAGILDFSASSYDVQEGAGAVGLMVGRRGGSEGMVSVRYQTVDDTAVAGTDYTAVSGTLSWANGETGAKTIDVPVLDNQVADGDLDFDVELFGAGGGASVGANDTASVTIADDDNPTGPCMADADTACLNDDRFQVEIEWEAADGREGQATKVDLTDDGAWFWFFNQANPEMFVKVLDACTETLGNRYWVFAAGLTNVEVTLTVTDTETGLVREYENELGDAFEALQDTSAFSSCP